MPPKKGGGAPAAGSKVKEDKTFGMKNKKGSKAQQQVKIIQQQQAQQGKNKEALAKEKQKEHEKKLKAEAEKRRAMEGDLFTIVQPKVPFGVDPQTITCAFWKAGRCDKGSKCKFAHSQDASRKVQKKDLYTDTREGEDKQNDTMDKWDQAKLDSVILSKHGNPRSTTDKVCKFFLQAVEDGKYGWFWECPNGGEKCMYKHRLPPGFVLKAQKKEQEAAEKANEITLEDFLEVERHRLGSNLTPVTAESFEKWKKERMEKKAAEEEAQKKKKETQAAANKVAGLSGRELFTYNPEYYGDEGSEGGEDEFDMSKYRTADWEQNQLSDDEDEEKENGYQDGSEDEEGEGGVGSVNGRMTSLSVNGNGNGGGEGGEEDGDEGSPGKEGAEEGRRKGDGDGNGV